MSWSQVIVGALVFGFSIGIGQELIRDALFAIRNAVYRRKHRVRSFPEIESSLLRIVAGKPPALQCTCSQLRREKGLPHWCECPLYDGDGK